jgi:hypothetical protein
MFGRSVRLRGSSSRRYRKLIIKHKINPYNTLENDRIIREEKNDMEEKEKQSCLWSEERLSRGNQWLAALNPSQLSNKFNDSVFIKLLHTDNRAVVAISKDVHRTYPLSPLFQSSYGQLFLSNILVAYSNYDLTVGYSQGMAFLVCNLLFHVNDEELAFWCFIQLMYHGKYSMRILYTYHLGALLTLLQTALEAENTTYHTHSITKSIKSFSIECNLYATQWLVTIYSYRFPLEFTELIWDYFIETGFIALFHIAIAIIHTIQHNLCNLHFEELIAYLTNLPPNILNHKIIEKAKSIQLSQPITQALEKIMCNAND